jgi:hypothetical protein
MREVDGSIADFRYLFAYESTRGEDPTSGDGLLVR